MVVIRLSRTGRKHSPMYRVTVADSRRSATKKGIEVLGHYIPTPKGKQMKVTVDLAKYDEWVKKGAQPSPRVLSVIKAARTIASGAQA